MSDTATNQTPEGSTPNRETPEEGTPMSPTPKSPTPKSIWPGLTYTDALAGIAFLKEAFGFEERIVVPGDEPGQVRHSELAWPEGGRVMASSAGKADETFSRPPGSGSVYVVTDEPDRVYERAMAAGATLVREMREEDYGSRGFSVSDPEGNIWSFGTYAGS